MSENLQRRTFEVFFGKRQKDRTVEASISSTYPGKRGDLIEILGHGPENIDLSRGPEFPINLGHDTSSVNAGVAKNVRLGTDGKLRATLKFGRSKKATEIWNDIKDGILKFVSVGYEVLKTTKPNQAGEYLVSLWRLLEVSIVSVAMDPSVGIGRSLKHNARKDTIEEMRNFYEKNYTKSEKLIDDNYMRKIRNYYSKRTDMADFYRYLVEMKTVKTATGYTTYGPTHPSLRAEGLNEGDFTSGGVLAPPGYLDRVLMSRYASQIYRLCQVIKSQHNTIKIPVLDSSDRTQGMYVNMPVYRVSEAEAATAGTLRLGQNNLSLDKQIALVYASLELAEDFPAFEKFVFQALGSSIGFEIDRMAIRGSGVGGEWLGILNADCGIVVAKEGGQTAATIVTENLVKMRSRFSGSNSPGARWMVSQTAFPQLLTIGLAIGTAGAQPNFFSFRNGGTELDAMLGIPIIQSDFMEQLGSAGDIALVDWGRYMIAQKAIRQDSSIHVQYLTDEETLRVVYRSAGQPLDAKEITPFIGNETVSPIVTLAARS